MADQVVFSRCPFFRETFADKARADSNVKDKMTAFIKSKTENPMGPFGSSDKPYVGGGIFSKYVPGLKHAHLTHNISIMYTLSGSNPKLIKLYGLVNHDESGTGNPPNMNRQKSLGKKLVNQTFS